MYILSFIIQGLVTHNKFIQFQIFMKNYSNILKSKIEYSNIFGYKIFANRISEYIRKYLNYESNTRIYSFGQKSIFVFEYWIFGGQYSNIRIYSNIRPSLTWTLVYLVERKFCMKIITLYILSGLPGILW